MSDDPRYAERAAAFTARVKDVSEFLAGIDLVPPRRPVPMRVTWNMRGVAAMTRHDTQTRDSLHVLPRRSRHDAGGVLMQRGIRSR